MGLQSVRAENFGWNQPLSIGVAARKLPARASRFTTSWIIWKKVGTTPPLLPLFTLPQPKFWRRFNTFKITRKRFGPITRKSWSDAPKAIRRTFKRDWMRFTPSTESCGPTAGNHRFRRILMKGLLADNDVQRQVEILLHIFESEAWREIWRNLNL